MPKAKNERFENVYSQGGLSTMEIWADKETGVNYLFRTDGYAGGMTPLLDRDGKPVISPSRDNYCINNTVRKSAPCYFSPKLLYK